MTRVADVMTRGVRAATPSDTLVQAARAMAELDVGSLPVCDGDRLVGIVTDRDITVRGVAQERPLHLTRLAEVMSAEPRSCRPDDDLDDVIERMKQVQVRRLPVVDAAQHLVGIVALGDVALQARPAQTGDTLAAISEPGPARAPENATEAGYDAAAARPLAAGDAEIDGAGRDGTGPGTVRPGV